jgi:arabinose-5-phosphate isomerase
MQANKFRNDHKIKKFMTKNPYMVEKNMLVSDILYQMNKKKITNVCVYGKENKKKIIGVIHIHNLLKIVK